jgi:hypothetical protein
LRPEREGSKEKALSNLTLNLIRDFFKLNNSRKAEREDNTMNISIINKPNVKSELPLWRMVSGRQMARTGLNSVVA